MERTITFAELKRKLRDEIWPSGPPENLTNVINSFFVAGCMDMQRVIECLRENNVSLSPFCSTFFNAGLTFVNAPSSRAYIKRVYTIANGDWNNKVFYHRQDYGRLADWSQNFLHYTPPLNSGLPKLPLGDRYAEKTTDAKHGRARRGLWAINRKRIYLAPWIQSNETVVIEWDGVRTDWNDTDVLDLDVWDNLHQEALKLFVKESYERDYGSEITVAREAQTNYANKIALLINDCIDQLRQRSEEGSPWTYSATSAQLTAEKVPADDPVPAIAVIGGYGSGDEIEDTFTTLVKSWSPVAILTNGGNNGGNITDLAVWDRRAGQPFHDYIFPYAGNYGVGASANAFWPTMDVAELSSVGKFSEFFASTKQPFYDVVVGTVHFFIVHGGTSYTEQLQWLQAALALSTVRWKVVIINSSADIDQPFDKWGANLVIYGRAQSYERTATRIAFAMLGAPVGLKLSGSCAQLQVAAFSANGTQIDTLTIT